MRCGPERGRTQQTNGVQPLLAFLEVPLFRIVDDPDAPVLGLAILDVALVLRRITARLAGRRAGWLVASFWTVSPQAIHLALAALRRRWRCSARSRR